jgi:hypothetical protein
MLRRVTGPLAISSSTARRNPSRSTDPDKAGDGAGDVDGVEHPARTAKESTTVAAKRQISENALIERPGISIEGRKFI